MSALPRVAVLGVPRGGTSAVTGLLRILGFSLPPERFEPECILGESRRLRLIDPDYGQNAGAILGGLLALPDGTVWKDPAVGDYAHRVSWRGWRTVLVERDPFEVAASERRHGYLLPTEVHVSAARHRYRMIGRALAAQGVVPDLVVPFDSARLDAPRTLVALTEALALPHPTAEQVRYATDFLRPGGYRCPLPDVCGHRHPKPRRRRKS